MRALRLTAIAVFGLAAACSNPREEDERVCDGYACTAGYCISDNGTPACICDAYANAKHLACELRGRTDPNEPNDTLDTATPLARNTPVTAEVDPHGGTTTDYDYFRFDVAPGDAYWAILSGQDLQFAVLDASGQDLKATSGKATSAATLYVRVFAFPGQGAVPYTLTLFAGPDDYPDSPEGAPDLATVTSARFEYAHDVDVFRVPLVGTHYYDFGATSDDGTKEAASLIDASGNVVAAQPPFRCNADQVLFLRVAAGAEPTTYQPFLRDVGTDPDGNSAALATPIAVSTPLTRAFEVPSDEDWFVVNADSDTVYQATCTRPDNACDVSFFDDSGNELPRGGSSTNWGVRRGAGPLYLRVLSSSGTGTYSLTVDPFELGDPGSDLATGKALPVGASMAGQLFPGDVDVWQWDAPAGEYFTVDVTKDVADFSYPFFVGEDPANFHAPFIGYGDTGPYSIKTNKAQRLGFGVQSNALANYTLTLTDLGPDDFGDTYATATPMPLSTPQTGKLEQWFDADVFSVALTQGTPYLLSGSGAVWFFVEDENGRSIATLSSSSSTTLFTAPATRVYYVRVIAADGLSWGAYSVEVAPQ